MSFPGNGGPVNALNNFFFDGLVATKKSIGLDPGGAGVFPCGVSIFGYKIENNTASAIYLQFFNLASGTSITLGTTVPDWTVAVPASGAAIIDPKRVLKYFNLGCQLYATTTRTGSTAPATGATVDIWYSQH